MAKTKGTPVKTGTAAPAKAAPAEKAQDVATAAQDVAAKAAAGPTSRGPRGVPETALITVVATANPKRPGSKAAGWFAKYKTGMTVGEFCDIAGKDATPHLVWDANHDFISIDGFVKTKTYDPKAPKVPKAPKEAKAKTAKAPRVDADTDLDVEEETAD